MRLMGHCYFHERGAAGPRQARRQLFHILDMQNGCLSHYGKNKSSSSSYEIPWKYLPCIASFLLLLVSFYQHPGINDRIQ
jgi:hypothetical protein